MLLKLISPTGGEIIFAGKNIKEDNNAMLKQTGAVIERPDLYKYLTAYEHLSMFAKLSGIKPSRTIILEQLEIVGLADRANSKVKTFSQGMKQRLGIAVALIHFPKLVILDEPVNGLDPQGIADMRNLILSMRQTGKTVIVSSHLLGEIELIANRMLIIHKGKKIVEGEVAALLDPANTLVEIDTTDNSAAVSKLQQSSFADKIEKQKSKKIRLRMARTAIPEFVSSLHSMNIDLTSLQPRHSLEDYFLSLTNHEQHVQPFTD